MNILVIGQGGREHALAWKIAQSERCETVFLAPGNGGTKFEDKCENTNIEATDFEAIKKFIVEKEIGLVVVGPEDPLVKGIKDYLSDTNVLVFGPDSEGAQLEGSKIYSKQFMFDCNIPTGEAHFFNTQESAIKHLNSSNYPIVLKADGLAAGKGVLVAQTKEEAIVWVNEVMANSKFGEAGQNILIEECLYGTELSFMGIMTPNEFIPFETSVDYKPLLNGNKGPNTGGMGCIAPSPFMNDELRENIFKTVVEPTIKGLNDRGISYYGFMYFGLMVKDNVPKVLEYNCRLGDPETQCLMMKIESDLVAALLDALQNKQINISWRSGSTMGVVLASGGYPENYKKGVPIKIDELNGCKLFHAGTAFTEDGLVTSGGRVFSINYHANSIEDCKHYLYNHIDSVNFIDCTYRDDIGEVYES
jgi:phosphoribosylamine--glycine ligase